MIRDRLRYIDAGDLPAVIFCYAIVIVPAVLVIIWSRTA